MNAAEKIKPKSITTLNQLPQNERRETLKQLIPFGIIDHFDLSPFMVDSEGHDLFVIKGAPGSSSVEISLYHKDGFQDPVLYGHLTDTVNGQVHVLLYIMNDPNAPRFDVDVMPDGSPTQFGTFERNVEAEKAAFEFGILPGQIRKGLSLLSNATGAFEGFVKAMGHDRYFVEPLYYHNAIIFEKYGFRYQSGRRLMESIHSGFKNGGLYSDKLDGSVFRPFNANQSIRLRSWAIHDGILGHPFSDVTMYKVIDHNAQINTSPGISW